jgi:hypothetical protein
VCISVGWFPISKGMFWFQFLTFLKGSVLVWFGFFFPSNMDPVPVLVFKFGEQFWFLLFFYFQVKTGFNFQSNNPQFQVTFLLGSNIQNIKMDNGKKIKSEFLFKGRRMDNGTNNNKNLIPRNKIITMLLKS